jgi:hypothetical protein
MQSPRLHLVTVLLLVFVGVLLFWPRHRRNESTASSGGTRGPAAVVASASIGTEKGRNDADASGRIHVPANASLVQMRRVVEENAAPGRMVFLNLMLAADGLHWVSAVGAAGRVKPGLAQSGFGVIGYEVFDRAGRMALAGSVPDPTRHRLEHPAAGDDGKITSTVIVSAEGEFAIRLPGEADAARVVFFRNQEPPSTAGPPTRAGREILGELSLRPGS